MKKAISLLVLLVITWSMYATEKQLKSKMDNVTVYRQNAKITRSASTTVPSGISKIIFTDLETVIQAQSIQLKMSPGVKLLSVTYGIDYLKDREIGKKYKILADSVTLLNEEISWLSEQKKVLASEENLLNQNIKLGSTQEGVSVDELKALASYYSSRVKTIKKEYLDLNKKENKLKLIRTRIQNQMGQMNVNKSTPTGIITVEITAVSSKSANFELSYVVTGVSWTPIYDIFSEGLDKDVKIVYKANVIQSTGVDWKNVKLTINTGNPNTNNSRPILYPRYLTLYTPAYYDAPAAKSYENIAQMKSLDIKRVAKEDSEGMDDFYVPMEIVETMTNIEFRVDQQYNIPADGKAHLVTMSEYSVPAEYEYHTVPVLDKGAFLLAKLTNWGKLNLIAAYANIFLDNTYIGQSYINPNITVDTLLLSFGRDEKIIVDRQKVFSECKTSTLMGNRKHLLTFEIKIRNTKSSKITIDVLDQIPLSNNKDYIVELVERGGAEYLAKYGKLSWKLELKPNESKTIRFQYAVKHPKNVTLQGI
ncbi:MAG: DUF4139 domain-containing protein [Bacteroidetes bacterium]|nr:DUF4139 domain-containing protein [Bacteroidota bacterium]